MRLRRFLLKLTTLSLIFFPLSAVPVRAALEGTLIKSYAHPAVYYYLGGKRYVFPNEKTYYTWYSSFNNINIISPAELASYPLGGNVTYRPGVRLVKIQTDPRVYAVSRYGVVRWIKTELVAFALYGNGWMYKVHDIPDAFFTNYKIGDPIAVAGDYNKDAELGITLLAQNIQGAVVSNSPTPPTPPPSSSVVSIAGCQVFPADNAWNQDVSKLPVHSKSSTFINSISATKTLHSDFGEEQQYGIPYNVVPGSQPKVPINFTAYGDESDPGPYPIPPNAKVEQSGDGHVLVLDKDNCKLYELYIASKNGTGWDAESGAVFDLKSNALRPLGWTSTDAAGLPILPGLVRYEEVAAGEIQHAIRFTSQRTQKGYILPATHHAGLSNMDYPPMGLRVRLKADYDISGLTGQAKVIATAMKKYGMILADNGGSWFFSGETNPGWNDDDLRQLTKIPGSAFEAVYTGEIKK